MPESLPGAASDAQAGRISPLLLALLLAWLLVVLGLTLSPGSGTGTSAGPAPLADVVRNLILFAPLGLLLGLSGQSLLRAALLAGLISAAIEVCQLWIPGRHGGTRDVVVNTLGAAGGAACARALIGPLFRSPTSSARLALAGGAFAATVLMLPGFLLRPAPPASLYYPAWTPSFPGYVRYPGSVLEATIGDLPIEASGPSEYSAALRARLLDGSPITVRALSEERTAGIAPLVRINDGTWEILLVGVQGDDLLVRRHAIAGDLGLEEPLFRLPGALAPVAPGDAFELELAPVGAAWRVSTPDADARWIGPTPGAAWRLVADSDALSESPRRVLDAIALALLFCAIAVWFRPRWPAVAGLALALGALLLGPSVAGLVRPAAMEWAGSGVGLLCGAILQRWIGRTPVAQGAMPCSPDPDAA